MIVEEIIKKIRDIEVNFTLENLFERIEDRLRWPIKYPWGQPSIEVIDKENLKHQNFFDIQDGFVDPLKCIDAYHQGYSLLFSNVGYLQKDITKIKNILDKNFNINCNMNLYLGTGYKTPSFLSHTHEYPVLIKNIFGKSKWIIDNQEIVLEKQNCIFFNKEISHQVIEIMEPKLSLTCNLE